MPAYTVRRHRPFLLLKAEFAPSCAMPIILRLSDSRLEGQKLLGPLIEGALPSEDSKRPSVIAIIEKLCESFRPS